MDAASRWSVHKDVEQLLFEGIADGILRAGGQDGDDIPAARGARNCASWRRRGGVHAHQASRRWSAHTYPRRVEDLRSTRPHHRAPRLCDLPRFAEWRLRVRERYQGEDVEHAANYIAAAILSPRRAFRLALEQYGQDFVELARVFRVSQTHVALREAELASAPCAVVSPALVRRGPEAWAWPDEAVVRRWARLPASGLRKVKLTDDPRRVVLDAEGDVG